jgi:phosphoglycerate-specific signal transduction histidine kinase
MERTQHMPTLDEIRGRVADFPGDVPETYNRIIEDRSLLLSIVDNLSNSHEQLRDELANAAHRVRWLMQFANVDKEPIEQELAKWDALSSAKATP